jgi:hypothetical protein
MSFMYAIRILTGPQAGQILPLKDGKNNIGRSPSCEVKIASSSVSKEHACVLVIDDKLILSDLNSRNGTFVNGVRIQNQRIEPGDKFALHDVLFDILKVPDGATLMPPRQAYQAAMHAPAPAWAGAAAVRLQEHHAAVAQAHDHVNPHDFAQDELAAQAAGDEHPQPKYSAGSVQDLINNFKVYIDHVAMPGVYALVQSLPYRWALGALVAIYVVAVTALSVVPMMSVTKSAIRTESLRRAKTIARNLAAANRQAVLEKNELALTTRPADVEEGVSASFIISAEDGTVIAPSSKRGEFVNKPFVNTAWRNKGEESESFIDNSSLGVAIPITYYNPSTSNQSTAAFAIVLYDMGALAMSSIQSLSLFIQILALALLTGALLYFFLYKIVEEPIRNLNAALDDALREGRDDLQTKYRFPALESLASNINSALSRIVNLPPDQMAMAPVVNRDLEAANIVRMLPVAACAVNAIDDRVIATNTTFDKLIGGGVNLPGRPLTDIPDPALQANLTDLLPRMRSSLGEIALSEIPFFGNKYEICGQAVMGTSDPAYFLITLHQQGGD